MTEKMLRQELEREQAKNRRAERDREREEAKSRLLQALIKCVGKGRALGMAEAFEAAYPERDWSHRINDTRAVRVLITRLRRGDPKTNTPPLPICSSCCNIRPGYYIPVGQELEEYLKRKENQYLRGLGLVARLRRVALPDYLGQMALARRAAEGAG